MSITSCAIIADTLRFCMGESRPFTPKIFHLFFASLIKSNVCMAFNLNFSKKEEEEEEEEEEEK